MEKKREENLIVFPPKLTLRLYLSSRTLLNTHPRGGTDAVSPARPSGNLQSNENLTTST